jgi:hypothetical protein
MRKVLPFAQFTLQLNCAAEAANDAVDNGQTDAAPHGFGAEERLENSGLNFRPHATAVVGHLNLYLIAFAPRALWGN